MISDRLPDGWTVRRISDLNVAQTVKINPSRFADEQFEYYSIPAYQNGETPELTEGKNILSQKSLVPPRCVLFGKLNPRVEKVWNVKSDSQFRRIASTEWLPIIPGPEFSQDWVYFLIYSQWVMPIAKSLVTGSTPSRQRVDPKSFYEIEVPAPPLDEQRAIAEILSLVEDAIRHQQVQTNCLLALKRTAMQSLFTRGLHCEAQKETEIGPVPESWSVMPFDSAILLKRGFDLPKSKRRKGTVPVFGSNGIVGHHNRRPADIPIPGVMVGRSGSVGKVSFSVDAYWPLNTTLFAEDFMGNVQRFIGYFLDYFDFSRFAAGVSVPTLNRNSFAGVRVAIPPFDDQHKIADILEAIDRKVNLHRRKRAMLEELFKSLLHKLMTGEVRVADLNLPELPKITTMKTKRASEVRT